MNDRAESMNSKKVLLVEDDQGISDLLRTQIDLLGYEMEHAATGPEGLSLALANRYDLVVLDLNLPGLGGLEILREIRARDQAAQVIMLTARGSELDRVVGLELGADDYIVKPFSLPELTARIRSRLRQVRATGQGSGSPHAPSEAIRFGELMLDPLRRTLTISGTPVDLTTLELDLILFLASRPGVPFSRNDLMEAVWGYEQESYESNVNSTINRIRRKIELDPQDPKYLHTVRGLGYKWCEPS